MKHVARARLTPQSPNKALQTIIDALSFPMIAIEAGFERTLCLAWPVHSNVSCMYQSGCPPATLEPDSGPFAGLQTGRPELGKPPSSQGLRKETVSRSPV